MADPKYTFFYYDQKSDCYKASNEKGEVSPCRRTIKQVLQLIYVDQNPPPVDPKQGETSPRTGAVPGDGGGGGGGGTTNGTVSGGTSTGAGGGASA